MSSALERLAELERQLQLRLAAYNEEHKQLKTPSELLEEETEIQIIEVSEGHSVYERSSGFMELPGNDDELFNMGMVAERSGISDEEREWGRGDVEKILEDYFSLPLEKLRQVYGPGYPGEEDRKLRAAMDEKLLRRKEAGGNMAELARLLGFAIRKNGECRAMSNALTRARKARSEA